MQRFPHQEPQREGILNISVGIRVTVYHPTIRRGSNRGCHINMPRNSLGGFPPKGEPSSQNYAGVQGVLVRHWDRGSEDKRIQGHCVGLSPVLIIKLLPLVQNSGLNTLLDVAGARTPETPFGSAARGRWRDTAFPGRETHLQLHWRLAVCCLGA